MGKRLLSGFAQDDPERFAQLLGGSNDLQEAIEILTDIPDGLEADLVSRLSPDVASRLVSELPDPVVIAWLSSCSSDSARSMLTRIGHERAVRLIAGIDSRSKRLRLQQLMKYPQGTVGEVVLLNVLTVRDSMPVSEIATAIQRQHGGTDAPIVILRKDGTVSGVLDLVMFLKNHDLDTRADDFRIPVRPVYAEAALSSLKDRDEWKRLTSLPVVDYEGQLIGYVSRTRFESYIKSVTESGIFLQAGLELSRQFLEFMVYLLMLVFDRRSPK